MKHKFIGKWDTWNYPKRVWVYPINKKLNRKIAKVFMDEESIPKDGHCSALLPLEEANTVMPREKYKKLEKGEEVTFMTDQLRFLYGLKI